MHGPRGDTLAIRRPVRQIQEKVNHLSRKSQLSWVMGSYRLAMVLVCLGVFCCVSEASDAAFTAPMRLRGGSEMPQLTEQQMRRLPWYLILENSPLKLGDGPYGVPYVAGKVNPKNTLWETNPKLAMSKTLWNAAEDNAELDASARLLKIGADPNYADPNTKATPLHLAAMHGNTELAVMLIESGGDIKKRSKKSGTPLDIARSYQHEDTVTAMLEAAARKK